MLAVTLCLLNSLTAVDVPWDSARLRLDDAGRLASLTLGGREVGVPGTPFCRLQTADGLLDPVSAQQQGDRVTVGFPGGAVLVYRVMAGAGHVWFDLAEVSGIALDQVEAIRVCDLNVEGLPVSRGVLNAVYDDHDTVAVMAGKVNVQTVTSSMGQRGASFEKCRHNFLPETERVKQGKRAGRFPATSERDDNDGWAYRGRAVTPAVDLTGLQAIKAWVHGDGNGQLLKIQLSDRKGYRDDYVRIDFTGWREVTLDQPQLNTIDPAHVRALGIYYNLLPGRKSVECVVDSIRAVVDGREVMLEDFEAADGELWDGRGTALRAITSRDHGLLPAGFGLIACPRNQFATAIDAFERAAGLPHPRPGGGSHADSPWSKRSYLFISSYGEADTDQVIAWAKRGGMPMVLIGAGSWNVTCGTHAVNDDYFPGGLPSLQRAADRLHQAGLRVGLHFLAPAVYPNDPLVRPKPDPRLFKGARLPLAAGVDDKAALIPTDAAPTAFPAEDGGYLGDGTYLQIDDELIQYGALQLTPPYGFAGCVRGANGSVAAAHAKGAAVAHLMRSYGYFLFDLDSTLADEVTGNVARVANAIQADMLYFDGSERLQSGGADHWYDNAKLQSLYYEKLTNQDTFLQGSSFSPFSWHVIQRSASADGHGDVKGYLDERTPSFSWLGSNLMPLDCGWYYVYDPEVTADQYDYILQRCLGFDCSISVQTNPANLSTHPDIGTIFDLCNVYERLRLSGRVPEETRAKLREPKREYRLLRQPLRLRRTVFGPWQELAGASATCDEKPLMPGARVGLQLRCGAMLKPGPAYRSDKAVTLETFDDLAPYLRDPQNRFGVFVIGPEGAGSCREGCTQEFASEEGGPEGARCGRYTATSTRADNAGYTSIGKHFAPPLDLTLHAGIGFWLKGDGNGGSFKLQIRQGPNATDYYIANDFTIWRYFQLVRPDKPSPLPVDYTKIDYLIFYYNGLPANRTVTCWIDDVKALPALDRAAVTNPAVEAGGRTIVFPATLTDGERLCWFPGEAPYVIPATAGERRVLPAVAEVALDPAAPATLRLPADSSGAPKLRWVQDCPEELPLPEEALATPLPPLQDR